ncbi:MAG: MFS transporter [Sulfuricellaceae bacterium]|jgi:MFS family permease
MGLIDGVAEATVSLLKLFSGVLVDRFGRAKGWVVMGYSLTALSRLLFYLAASWPAVLALRFADQVGKGLLTSPLDALLAATAGENQRGLAFGLHRAMDNAGAVVGPLLAAGFLEMGVPLRDVFLWALTHGAFSFSVVCALMAALLLKFWVKGGQ